MLANQLRTVEIELQDPRLHLIQSSLLSLFPGVYWCLLLARESKDCYQLLFDSNKNSYDVKLLDLNSKQPLNPQSDYSNVYFDRRLTRIYFQVNLRDSNFDNYEKLTLFTVDVLASRITLISHILDSFRPFVSDSRGNIFQGRYLFKQN